MTESKPAKRRRRVGVKRQARSSRTKAENAKRMREWRKANPEKVKAQNARYGPARRDAWREWRDKNRDLFNEYSKRYRREHKRELAEYRRGWYWKNKLRDRPKRKAYDLIARLCARGYLSTPTGKCFHHPDYARHYWGCWVTPYQSVAIRWGRMECPPCFDYEPVIRAIRGHKKRMRYLKLYATRRRETPTRRSPITLAAFICLNREVKEA